MNERHILGFIIGCLIGLVGLLIMDSRQLTREPVSTSPPPLPTKPHTITISDNECWFENFPVLHYRVNEQAVDVMITCKTTIIDAHLPAIERTQ